MCSLKLTFALSVYVFLLVSIKEAAVTSKPSDLSGQEKLQLAFAQLSENMIQLKQEMKQMKQEADGNVMQLKEEMKQMKQEADENVIQLKEEMKQMKQEADENVIQLKEEMNQMKQGAEEIQQVKKEAEEEIQQVRKEAEEKILKFQEEVKEQIQEIKTEMQKNNNATRRKVSTIEQMSSWFSDSSHDFRTSRHVGTYGYADFNDLQQLYALLSIPASCYEWKKHGFKKSGFYLIDSDGAGTGTPPFTVYCDMKSGSTVIHHDSERSRRAESCSGPKCYTKTIHYNGGPQQILGVMFRSDRCEQHIKIDCLENPLKKDGEILSTWTDRQGREQEYWVGDGDSHTCACGLSESCIDPEKSCNCDASVEGVTLSDEGYLSNMTSLPVKSLQFGSPVDKPLQMNYTVGPLTCYWSRPVSEPRSCRDLLLAGHSMSGYYFLNTDGSLDVTYCDMKEMNLLPKNDMDLTVVTQLRNELEKYKQHQVAFSAHASERIITSERTIVFERVTLDVGDGYDGSTGIFTAPVAGLYYISVHLRKGLGDHAFDIFLRKNGQSISVASVYTIDDDDMILIGTIIIETLEVGDQIYVTLFAGNLSRYDNSVGRFNGFLLK